MMLWLQAGITIYIALFVSACSGDKQSSASTRQTVATLPSEVNRVDRANDAKAYSDRVYQILLAEYHYQQGEYQKSSFLYSNILAKIDFSESSSIVDGSTSEVSHSDRGTLSSTGEKNKKPKKTEAKSDVKKNKVSVKKASRIALVKRSTELAVKIEDYDQAFIAAKRWKKLASDSSSVNQYLILLYQKKGQYGESARVLAELVKSYPSKKNKPIDVAVALLEQQAVAKDAYQTLKHYNNDNNSDNEDDANYYLAIFAMRAKLYDDVLAVTENFEQLENKELRRKSALLRVKVYTAMDKPNKALEELKELITEAADPVTRQTYARLMASLGKAEEAVAMLQQVYEKHPKKSGLLLDMIAINLGENRYEENLPLLDKLQAIEGREASARYFRGVIFEYQKKYPEALKEYQAIDETNLSMQVFARMASVLEKVEGISSVQSYLHEKQKKYSGKSYEGELYLLESEVLRGANHFKKALAANQKAEKLAPMDLDILYSQALLYEDISQIKKSEEKLLKILDIDKNHTSALNALGYMLSVHTTRFDEAYQYIKKAHDLRPDDPAIIDSLGWISYRKGDLKDAEKYLRLAYQKLKDPEVASHLVEVLVKQGQQKEAASLLVEMLKKHPKNKKLIETQALINNIH